ncbi:MAG: cation transporter [Actinomycetota bacterium]|nr:cation transporter [Actinomycetota bacterium]
MAANKGASDEERGTKRSVLAAFVANFLIAISKFVAGFISGSAAMLAEGAHSVADTVNQVFLLISLPLSRAPRIGSTPMVTERTVSSGRSWSPWGSSWLAPSSQSTRA